MIKRVLYVLLIFMVVSIAILWLIFGGIKKISFSANSISNPIGLIIGTGTISDYTIHLPWQPTELTQGPDISGYTSEDGQSYQTADEIQSGIDDTQKKINDAKTFGTPSPYKSKVQLAGRESADNGSSVEEFILVRANAGNTSPVLISGWSVQSVLSGKRVPLPRAASLFVLGVVNPVTTVSLNPGQVAIVNTGVSPVGVSFRENICSGYLSQFQTFSPSIETSCPDPKNALPETPENLQRYGAACIGFVDNLPTCTFPGNYLPSTLPPSCKAFVANTYTYNGCVNMYQYRTNFKKDTWRLFLSVSEPLWNSEHDIIRLLDAEGRTVDVLSY